MSEEPDMRPVYSSHISAIGWSENELWVRFDDGKITVYEGVPETLGKQVMNAPSVGSAMHSSIRGNFKFRYV